MSENTVIYLIEQFDGTWDVTRCWMEDDQPELKGYRRTGLTFDEARTYAESLNAAEYGIQLAPRSSERDKDTYPNCGSRSGAR